MFQKFRKKPIEIVAFQFTKEKHDYLKKNVKKNENENPVDVRMLDIPDAELEWNWFTQQLYIMTSEGQMEVNVGDWVIREPFDKVRRYYPVKNEIFVQTYDAVV